MTTKFVPYYTLLVYDLDIGWTPQFGDYCRHTVKAEMEDYQYSQGIRRKDMRILAVDNDSMAALEAALCKLNGVAA